MGRGMVQGQVLWRLRLGGRQGLGNSGVRSWQPAPSPGLTGGPSPKQAEIFLILSFNCSVRPRAVVYKLGCALEAPGEL